MSDGLQGELVWRQSTACEGGACITVAATDDAVMVRNPAYPGGLHVTLSHTEWREFLADVRKGTFDRL
jgi:Domain of unknown function (DUF397)